MSLSGVDVEKYSVSHRCCRTAAKASLNVACSLAYQALLLTAKPPSRYRSWANSDTSEYSPNRHGVIRSTAMSDH